MTDKDLKNYSLRIPQATRSELIVIMYEVTIEYLNDAIGYLSENNNKMFSFSLKKAKSFINELSSVLDLKYEISLRLLSIYTFINNAIVRADIRRTDEELKRIVVMIEELKEAFTEVSKSDKSEPMMQNIQSVYAGLTYSRNGFNENLGEKGNNRGYRV